MAKRLKRKVKYKEFIFTIEEMHKGYYGVLASKKGKKRMVLSGHQQYIGVGKGRLKAISDAKHTIDKYMRKH
jgi:hypothetical protein